MTATPPASRPLSCTVRRAGPRDATALKRLIESGYRGESARRGWTHEADIVAGERIARADLDAMLADPSVHVLVAEGTGPISACVAVTDRGDGHAYFGLLCVDPALQGARLGSRMMAEAEALARGFGARIMEISVIDRRSLLIEWYERAGYVDTGRRDPFPAAQDPPLFFCVMHKPLD